MAQSKRSETILVNEFLAFVQNKLDIMDEVSLSQICTTSYTEAEIIAAKKFLADTAATSIRLSTRHKDGTGKKDLQDIFRVFKETEPDDVPTYVAKDLYKLPPITWDHVDTTRVLKDIMLLRADVTDLRMKLEASESTVSELRSELVALRNSAAQAKLPSPASTQNVTVRRPVQRNTRLSTPAVSHDATTDDIDRPTLSATDTPSPQLLASPVLPAPSRKQKKSYAQVTGPNRSMHSNTTVTDKNARSVNKPNIDADGFTLVENKVRSRKNRNQRGTAKGTTSSLHVVPPTTKIYISRLDNDTKTDDVQRYICGKLQQEDSMRMCLKELEQKRPTDFKSYVLQVPAEHKKMFLVPEFWPAGVVYRKYRDTRPAKIPETRSAPILK